jgi:putative ABC transport system permease protein
VLNTFDQIFTTLTLTVGGIAAISLAVAGVLIMNVMLVSVSQRTNEVGVLKAVGATSKQIVTLFLAEAALLSLFGALLGLGVGLAGSWLVTQLYPTLNMTPPIWAAFAAVATAVATGLVFGILPARRAARLDPVLALARH